MSRRPNILMIVTDEQRYNIPRPEGFALPQQERLAASGVVFENYYAASAQCSSSRSVMYTGQHVPHTQIYDNDNMPYIRPLDPTLGTVGTMLRAAGYYCTYQGKWHLSRAYRDSSDARSTTDALEPYGFSEWNDWGDIDGGAWAGLKVDPVIAGQAARWLRSRQPIVASEQPWFMAVNFVNPHDIMSFDYGGRPAVQLPEGLAHAVVAKPPANVPIYQKSWSFEVASTLHDDLSGAAPAVREYAALMDNVFGAVTDDQRWYDGMNFYLNCLRDVDRHVGIVLDALEASGEADHTMVVFVSDHGDMVGSHGLRQKGNLVYDENFHVPLIVRHPDVSGGTTSPALVSAVDLVPTMLEVAGIDAAEAATAYPQLHGSSILTAMAGGSIREGVLTAVESVATLDADFWHHFADPGVAARIQEGSLRPDWSKRGFLRGYTDDRYTFGRYFSPLEPNRPTTLDSLFTDNDVVLYDRLSDPGESVNLASSVAHRDVVVRYHAKLEALISSEIGDDTRSWVTEQPQLLGWPTWQGDTAA